MREEHFSRTAAYVALLRALGDRGVTSASGFVDPTARALLPPRWARAAAALPWAIARLPPRTRDRIAAHVDLLVCRSLAIDAALTAAIARGCTQVVILGAGFDGRVHRMPALANAHVFEVDHPATQSEKRRRTGDLGRTCRELTYVACDFERDALDERLASSGHRRDEPTVWIWEGVTLYLHDAAIHGTLATLAARSAPGSTLVVEYHDADVRTPASTYTIARKVLLALWSEPHIGLRTRHTMHAELSAAGLHVDDDVPILARAGRARLAIANVIA